MRFALSAAYVDVCAETGHALQTLELVNEETGHQLWVRVVVDEHDEGGEISGLFGDEAAVRWVRENADGCVEAVRAAVGRGQAIDLFSRVWRPSFETVGEVA